MIAGIFHEGSGLGDQLFRYITVRTLSQEKQTEFGMVGVKNFKGSGFLDPFIRYDVKPDDSFKTWDEKDVRDANGLDIRSYDPEINFVEDNTIVDGSFEDEKYWGHNLANISKWLAVEPLEVPDDTCVVGFRGGEYAGNPDLFLGNDYYMGAIERMQKAGVLNFKVHTDDPMMAGNFFANFGCIEDGDIVENQPISHSKHTNMGYNWRSARYAKYAVIPNSAFFILPRLLKHFEDPTAVTIAPRYWARRNTKVWARPACYYKPFTYI